MTLMSSLKPNLLFMVEIAKICTRSHEALYTLIRGTPTRHFDDFTYYVPALVIIPISENIVQMTP